MLRICNLLSCSKKITYCVTFASFVCISYHVHCAIFLCLSIYRWLDLSEKLMEIMPANSVKTVSFLPHISLEKMALMKPLLFWSFNYCKYENLGKNTHSSSQDERRRSNTSNFGKWKNCLRGDFLFHIWLQTIETIFHAHFFPQSTENKP